MHKDHKGRICRDDTEVWIFYPLFQQTSHPYMEEGEEGVRGWDGWMVSPMQWTGTWANSRRWWGTGRPGVRQPMGLQRVRHKWATEHTCTHTPPLHRKGLGHLVCLVQVRNLQRILSYELTFLGEETVAELGFLWEKTTGSLWQHWLQRKWT